MVTRHHGDHFEIYRNIKSLCCILRTNITLYVKCEHTKTAKKKIRSMVTNTNTKIGERGQICGYLGWRD